MKELSKLIDKFIIEKLEAKERNLEIEINFYNSIESSIYYNIEVFSDRGVPPLAITFKKGWKAFKNGMRWGTEKEIEEALEHAIKVDFERNKK